VIDGLRARLAPRGVFERSEGGVRAEEGLAAARGVLAGEEPPARLVIVEADAQFLVDVVHGQKTGFFLDQRESRARVRALAGGRRVLNAFSSPGAFAIAAALGGAREVVSVDTSRSALALAEAAWAENGLDPGRHKIVVGDVFDFLRDGDERWDLIVLDPPPLVRRRRDLPAGLRGSKDVNLHALRRLEPGGWLLTCSCSQHLSRTGFREVVTFAASDAGRVPQVVIEAGHPVDHPVALGHPEGEYLKVLLLRA
jgi:23S rRNA (cytosine1962-C5)-methyltransferase